MRKILLLIAHPNLNESQINRTLLHAYEGLEQVTVRDLYQLYPDGVIDIEAEQQHLVEADVVVFQHPFFWYSIPALLKEWIDLVLQYNFAYGPKGKALVGKAWCSVISTGSLADAYSETGVHNHNIRAFTLPLEQTAKLCGMNFLPPFVCFGARELASDKPTLDKHVSEYRQLLNWFGDANFELAPLMSNKLMNQAWEQ